MKKEGLYLIGILLLLPTVFAGTVLMPKSSEMYADPNLTFIMGSAITFASPVGINDDGNAIFGAQAFSVSRNTGAINVTILNYSDSPSGTNFWFNILGQNKTVTIIITNPPFGVAGTLVETNSTGSQTGITAENFDSTNGVSINATDSGGKYFKLQFKSVGGSSGGGASQTTATTLKTQIVCIQDTKYCYDGVYVKRDPNNNCEFSQCPTSTKTSVSENAKGIWSDIKVKTENVFNDIKGNGLVTSTGEPKNLGQRIKAGLTSLKDTLAKPFHGIGEFVSSTVHNIIQQFKNMI